MARGDQGADPAAGVEVEGRDVAVGAVLTQRGQPLREPAGEEPFAAEEEKQTRWRRMPGGRSSGGGACSREGATRPGQDKLGFEGGEGEQDSRGDWVIAAEQPAGGQNQNGDKECGLLHPQAKDDRPAAEAEQGDRDGAAGAHAPVHELKAEEEAGEESGSEDEEKEQAQRRPGQAGNGASRTARRMG